MLPLTVLILAKNEEHNIEDCIASVLFASEIIIIDDFSSDDTLRIASNMGAKVIQRKLAGDWGAQRTFAIEQATYPWIFFIDADERVSPALAREMTNIVTKNKCNVAYAIARLNFIQGKPIRHGGWFPDYVVRLFPRDGTHSEGLVHEHICHIYPEQKLPTDCFIVHKPYRDFEHHISKINLYTTLAAKKMALAGKSSTILDVTLRPMWGFIRMYILRLGFLDGKIGFILACLHYFYTLFKYVKLSYISDKIS